MKFQSREEHTDCFLFLCFYFSFPSFTVDIRSNMTEIGKDSLVLQLHSFIYYLFDKQYFGIPTMCQALCQTWVLCDEASRCEENQWTERENENIKHTHICTLTHMGVFCICILFIHICEYSLYLLYILHIVFICIRMYMVMNSPKCYDGNELVQ